MVACIKGRSSAGTVDALQVDSRCACMAPSHRLTLHASFYRFKVLTPNDLEGCAWQRTHGEPPQDVLLCFQSVVRRVAVARDSRCNKVVTKDKRRVMSIKVDPFKSWGYLCAGS